MFEHFCVRRLRYFLVNEEPTDLVRQDYNCQHLEHNEQCFVPYLSSGLKMILRLLLKVAVKMTHQK